MKIKEFVKKNVVAVAVTSVIVVMSIVFVGIYAATPTYTTYSMTDSYGHTLPLFTVRELPFNNTVVLKSGVNDHIDLTKEELKYYTENVEQEYSSIFPDAHMTHKEVETW